MVGPFEAEVVASIRMDDPLDLVKLRLSRFDDLTFEGLDLNHLHVV